MAPSTAPGERDLRVILSSLTTTLHPDTLIFVTMPDSITLIGELPPSLDAQMVFQEAEGLTIITTEAAAISHGLLFSFPSRMITLNVDAGLEAMGFIARVASELAENDIDVNIMSGFFHKHLFVPVGREQVAIEVLDKLARDSGRG